VPPRHLASFDLAWLFGFRGLPDHKKQKPGTCPGFIAIGRTERPLNNRQFTLPKVLVKPSFIGSAVSVQTFCACS
jgi:hypothetical protein